MWWSFLILGLGGFYFVRFRAELRRSEWLQKGQVETARAAEGELSVDELAGGVLAAIAERLGARAGGVLRA